jgi:hypothetical protein
VVAPSAPIKLVSPILVLVCSSCCKLSRTKTPERYIENISYHKGASFFVLEMMPKYKNKLEFLNTISHEMVHLWQQTIMKDTGNHNKIFFSFKSKFKRLNLTLGY